MWQLNMYIWKLSTAVWHHICWYFLGLLFLGQMVVWWLITLHKARNYLIIHLKEKKISTALADSRMSSLIVKQQMWYYYARNCHHIACMMQPWTNFLGSRFRCLRWKYFCLCSSFRFLFFSELLIVIKFNL